MSVYLRFPRHGFPSLITTNTLDRSPLFGEDAASRMVLQVISEVRAETRITLYADVIMPDHLHFVLTTPEATPGGEVMRRIKGRFANRWNRHAAGRGAVWQPRYHERALRTERALERAVDYVHWNPVTAGLCARPEDYPWSSAPRSGYSTVIRSPCRGTQPDRLAANSCVVRQAESLCRTNR